jgi:hypothetical protein
MTAIDRERAQGVQEPALQAPVEELLLGDVVHRPPHHRRDDERVQEGAVVGGEDDRAALGDVLAADAAQPEVDVEERLEGRADEPVHEWVDATVASPVQEGVARH